MRFCTFDFYPIRMRFINLIYLSFLSLILFGQSSYPYNIGMRSQYGFILNHAETMEYITAQHFPAFEIYFEKETFGKKEWQKAYHFPKWGFAFYTANFNQYIGKGFNLHPYISFPIINKDKFELDFRVGSGIGYITKPYDPTLNYKNVAIGTHLNATFSFMLDASFKLSPQLKLHSNFVFTHFSNTSFAKPNLGINIPTAGLGLSYHFGKKQSIDTTSLNSFDKKLNKWVYKISASFGVNETYTVINKKYIAAVASISAEKQLNRKSRIGFEANVFQNPALAAALRSLGESIDKDIEVLQLGIGPSYTLTIDNFGIFLQAGFYLKTRFKEVGNMYHRVGGIYDFNDKLSAHLILKTHFATAEYLEFGLGYKLRR